MFLAGKPQKPQKMQGELGNFLSNKTVEEIQISENGQRTFKKWEDQGVAVVPAMARHSLSLILKPLCNKENSFIHKPKC